MTLSQYIDHTLLKPEATEEQITQLCQEAMEFNFYSVCVNSMYVPLCKKLLTGSSVKVCSVVGFPLGAMSSNAKAYETKLAVDQGADEIDMVLSIGALKQGLLQYVQNDIRGVVEAASGRIVKVILETSLLTEQEKKSACKASMDAQAHFVKTSTGFSTGGATVEDVKLMKLIVGSLLEVKASGGIKNAQQAKDMIAAGASRLGTSSGVNIVNGGQAQGGY